jgi:hypothetical protein
MRGAIRALLGVAGALAAASAGSASERESVLATGRFVFFSDFETNLDDALIAAGVARRFDRPELFTAGSELACFEALAPSARAGWRGAAAYYAEIVSPAEWNARQQYLLRMDLAGFDAELDDDAARQYAGIARGFRAAAAPAYRACRWSAQDEKNRRWIAAVGPQLAAHEAAIAPRLESVYRKRWNGRPIQVDLVETVNWAGANSTFPDAVGGHLLISSENPAATALELVFHEASHGLMLRDDPLWRALDAAAAAAQVEAPRDLWHAVLFFTTGEVVRQALAEAGQREYTPIVYELFARGSWDEQRAALETEWRPYVRGERTLDAAAAQLVAAVAAPVPSK